MKSEQVIYEEATGKVAMLIQSSDPVLATQLAKLNTPDGHAVLGTPVGALNAPGIHYVANGELVSSVDAPSANHEFDYALKQWFDTRTLAELKSTKLAEINSSRLNANRNSFTFKGKLISCDVLSRSDIDGVNGYVSLLGALPPNWPGVWKAIDNSYVGILDVPAWIAFYSAMIIQGQLNFAHSEELKRGLADTNATVDSVNAIVW